MVREQIFTAENLQRRGISLASQCVMCKGAEEEINHLFVGCQVAAQVWQKLMGAVGGIQFLTVKDFVCNWMRYERTDHGKVMFRWLPHAVFWTLWKERNRRVFHEETLTINKIVSLVKELVFGL